MPYVGMNFINGEWQAARPDFSSYNPSTENEIGVFPQSTNEEVTKAVQAARKAQPAWRSLSRINRAEYFDRLAQIIKKETPHLVKCISQETGKTKNESLAEVNESLHMVQFTFGKGREPYGEVVASEIALKDSYIIRKPKGVVAVISPWNFGWAIGGFWCAAPALLEGNTVVFKPSEDTPVIGQIIAELYKEAGFPPGVFNLIHGDGKVGDTLVRSDVDHICFTGSAEAGQSIRRVCADSWHKTCSCELGSKSAVMVFADGDMELALNAAIASAYKLSGQRCVSASRILVECSIIVEFAEKFVEMSKRVKVGDPLDEENPDVMMGPLINRKQLNRVVEFNHLAACDAHTQVLLGTATGSGCAAPVGKGYFLTPFVYTTKWQFPEKRPFLAQEVFGPHVALIPFDGLDEAIDIYNDTEFGLALGVVTSDFKKAREIRERCDFGLGYWNSGSIAAESHVPFSGVKKSGVGGGSAAATFDAVSHKVTWTVNHGPLSFPQGLR